MEPGKLVLAKAKNSDSAQFSALRTDQSANITTPTQLNVSKSIYASINPTSGDAYVSINEGSPLTFTGTTVSDTGETYDAVSQTGIFDITIKDFINTKTTAGSRVLISNQVSPVSVGFEIMAVTGTTAGQYLLSMVVNDGTDACFGSTLVEYYPDSKAVDIHVWSDDGLTVYAQINDEEVASSEFTQTPTGAVATPTVKIGDATTGLFGTISGYSLGLVEGSLKTSALDTVGKFISGEYATIVPAGWFIGATAEINVTPLGYDPSL